MSANEDNDAATENILRIDNVTKAFGDFIAVDNISLTIPAKTIFGLLGPNGAGKSTLMRMITGLINPTKGEISLFGNLPPGSPKASANIGYMPQSPSLYPGLSIEENLQFFGRIYGLDSDTLATSVEETLEIISLADRRDELVVNLSGGMKQRALLGTAMIHKPKFLLLDEPTAGIDPILRIKIWDILRKLCDEGTSILITTHHISEADRCDHVVFLRDGQILTDGSPAGLMEEYGTSDLEATFVQAIEAE